MSLKPLCLAFALLVLMGEEAFAVGDVISGEKVFQKCVGCHTSAANTHAQGPTLVGVVGRPAAGLPGYAYSEGLKAFGATGAIWDEITLDKFLADTIGYVRGMKMVISPVRREKDRADLIAFLKSRN